MDSIKAKKSLLTILIVITCILSAIYWVHSLFYISTDDAYVNANVVPISPRITGQVVNLLVTNNQYVKENQALFEIDPEPYQIAVDQAKARLQISQAESNLAESTEKRTLQLVQKKVASAQEGDSVLTNAETANAKMLLEQANLNQALLNLKYTKVVAPTSGWVTNVALRIGQVVTANQHLFALISDNEYWIDANFKETELKHISIKQTADIESDMYPGRIFKGIVESISGGTGNAFSLLPPENATGNWVKVTQRVPVRVKVLNPDARYPLRIGTSATVTIHIHPWAS